MMSGSKETFCFVIKLRIYARIIPWAQQVSTDQRPEDPLGVKHCCLCEYINFKNKLRINKK